jgi:hypothetical protein
MALEAAIVENDRSHTTAARTRPLSSLASSGFSSAIRKWGPRRESPIVGRRERGTSAFTK